MFGRLSHRIKKGLLSICPYDEKTLSGETLNILIFTFLLIIISAFSVLLINLFIEGHVTVYSVVSSIFLTVILGRELPQNVINRKSERFLEDFMTYLSAVKRDYSYRKNITMSLLFAADGRSIEITKNAEEIQGILLTEDREKRIKQYIQNSSKNRFLKLFLLQVYEVSENGDEISDKNESGFSKNLELLRMEIINEYYDKKKSAYMFSGYLLVAIMPLFLAGAVRKAGLSMYAELNTFYSGLGNMLVLFIFITTWFIYKLISRLERRELSEIMSVTPKQWFVQRKFLRIVNETRDHIEDNNSLIIKKLKKLLKASGGQKTLFSLVHDIVVIFLMVIILGNVFFVTEKSSEKMAILNNPIAADKIELFATNRQKIQMAEAIAVTLGAVSKQKADDVTREYIGNEFNLNYGSCSDMVTEYCTGIICAALEKIDGIYIHWYEYLFVIVLGVLGSFIPVLQLMIQKVIREKNSTMEIRRMQAVLQLEKNRQRLTVPELLTSLELFSDIFKDELRMCINTYSYGTKEALERLKKDGIKKNPAFESIGDGFCSVDAVGISEAFSDVEKNTELLDRMEELEREINRDGKKNLLDIVSWIPGVLVLFGYLIIPFMEKSLEGTRDLFEMLGGL